MTLENCLFISITDLNKKGFFNLSKGDTLIDLKNNIGDCFKVAAEFETNENEKFVKFTILNETLLYNVVVHKISIVFLPSNVGNGFVKYFVCPITGKYCRKLYYHRRSFVHRQATDLLYEQQTKKRPISLAGYLTPEQRNEPNTKNFRKYYKGNMTKRYFGILLRTSHSEVIDVYKKGMLNHCSFM
jgi:hypothetical protein